MKLLYAPWRQYYAQNVNKDSGSKNNCVFCTTIKNKNDDEKNLVLGRYSKNIILMNKYPYNAGHILIVPHTHTGKLEELEKSAYLELSDLTYQAILLLQKELPCPGVNSGINISKESGAGIPSHLHQHIVPRWQGDTNFLPVLSNTKQVSVDMLTLYNKLKPLFLQLK